MQEVASSILAPPFTKRNRTTGTLIPHGFEVQALNLQRAQNVPGVRIELTQMLLEKKTTDQVLWCNRLAPKVLILVIRVQIPVEPFFFCKNAPPLETKTSKKILRSSRQLLHKRAQKRQGRPKSRNITTVIQLPGKIEKSADFFLPLHVVLVRH